MKMPDFERLSVLAVLVLSVGVDFFLRLLGVDIFLRLLGADIFLRLFTLFGLEVEESIRSKLEEASNKVKIRRIPTPTLIIHAEFDTILPLQEGRALYENSGAGDKEIFIIPGADHNNLWHVGGDQYYRKIEAFVKAH